MTTPSTPQTRPATRTLEYVIAWLEGGCDPKLAAKELRHLAAQPPAVAAIPEGMSTQLVIYLDEDSIDVGQFYRAKGFEKLPPTPTMSGAEIRACGWKKNDYPMYLDGGDGVPFKLIGTSEAVPLVNGMRFWCLPPATMGMS